MLQAFLFVLGIIFGSFFNVCIYRLPKDIGLNKNSSCTSCKKKINYYHNIPIFSYLFLKGRCSNCKKKISIFYPIVELITGLTFLISYRIYGISYEFIFFIIFYSSLLIIFFTDLNEFLILDKVSLPIGYLGLITSAIKLNPFKITFIESLIGAIAGYLLIFLIFSYGLINWILKTNFFLIDKTESSIHKKKIFNNLNIPLSGGLFFTIFTSIYFFQYYSLLILFLLKFHLNLFA